MFGAFEGKEIATEESPELNESNYAYRLNQHALSEEIRSRVPFQFSPAPAIKQTFEDDVLKLVAYFCPRNRSDCEPTLCHGKEFEIGNARLTASNRTCFDHPNAFTPFRIRFSSRVVVLEFLRRPGWDNQESRVESLFIPN